MTHHDLALFDLDDTLLDGDSEEMWARFLCRRGVVDMSFVLEVQAFYRQYEQGILDFHAYEEFLLGPLAVHPMTLLLALREEYLGEIRKVVRPQLLGRVERHRSEKCVLILITASNSFLAEPIAEMLGFSELICTQAEVAGDQYTGRICNVPAFQYGKVVRLAEWLRRRKMSLKGSWGYSDSHNDLPLLELVDHPVMVAPDAKLKEYGLGRGWELLELPVSLPPGPINTGLPAPA